MYGVLFLEATIYKKEIENSEPVQDLSSLEDYIFNFKIQSNLLGNDDNEHVSKGVCCNRGELLASTSASWGHIAPRVDAYNFSAPFILLFYHYYG